MRKGAVIGISTSLALSLVLSIGCAAKAPTAPEKLVNWPVVPQAGPPAPKLYLVRTGGLLADMSRLDTSQESREVELPVCVFVIDHPIQGLILVDTGYSRRTATDPGDYPGLINNWFLPVRMKPGEEAAAQLGRIGKRPEQVHTVILTHLHQDHTGGIEDFPDATYVVSRTEWEEGQTRASLSGYIQRSYAGIRTMRLIDFPTGKPRATFTSGVDLFGDGTIWLVPTPGHTAGHCSVLVNLPSRAVLLTGDAAYLEGYVTGQAKKGWLLRRFVDYDEDLFANSLARIRRFHELAPNALIVPGHDPDEWERLKHLPDFYE